MPAVAFAGVDSVIEERMPPHRGHMLASLAVDRACLSCVAGSPLPRSCRGACPAGARRWRSSAWDVNERYRWQSGNPPSPTRAPPYREAVSWRYCPVSPAPRQYHQHTCACAGALGSSRCESFSRSRHAPAALPAPAAFAEKRSRTAKAPARAPPSVADTVSRVTDLWSDSSASSWPLPFHRTRGPCSRHHLW